MSRETSPSEATQLPVAEADDLLMVELLMVESPWLYQAADDFGTVLHRRLRNGVWVTEAQLRRAARILAEGPQPIANGIRSNMPGFIWACENGWGRSLVLHVGILPSRMYRIDSLGRVRPGSATGNCVASEGDVSRLSRPCRRNSAAVVSNGGEQR